MRHRRFLRHPMWLWRHLRDRLFVRQDAETRRSPASITKIMTLLIVFEHLKNGRIHLEDLVTTSAYAKSMGVHRFSGRGETQTLETMIKCIAVASSNDASVAVAEYIAGSEGEFVKLMNEKAESLGMQNTHFETLCGLTDSDNHYTSAKDVAIMSRELITKYPEVLIIPESGWKILCIRRRRDIYFYFV